MALAEGLAAVGSAFEGSAEAAMAAEVADELEAEAGGAPAGVLANVPVDVPGDGLGGELADGFADVFADGLAGEVDDAEGSEISDCCRSVEPVGLAGPVEQVAAELAVESTEGAASVEPAGALTGIPVGRIGQAGSWLAGDMPLWLGVPAVIASDAVGYSVGAESAGAGVDAGERPAQQLGHAEQPEQPEPKRVSSCHLVS